MKVEIDEIKVQGEIYYPAKYFDTLKNTVAYLEKEVEKLRNRLEDEAIVTMKTLVLDKHTGKTSWISRSFDINKDNRVVDKIIQAYIDSQNKTKVNE